MSNTYIKFKPPHTGLQKLPENIGRRLIKTMMEDVIPIANPDFENKIANVDCWLIEFENDSYYPNREIGLDTAGNVIMIMPWEKNYGYWTDNDLVIGDFKSHFDTEQITRDEFERYWKMFVPTM